jgi:hypothetical protein
MEYPLYFVLLIVALLLNFRNKGNMDMLGIVVLSFYFPTEHITSHSLWWGAVFLFDIGILTISIYSTSLVSKPLFFVSFMMVLAHFLQCVSDVGATYKTILQYLEHLQMVVFILCAPNPIFYLKRKVKKCLKKFGYGY